ncbi:hypothetical protein ACJMK2_008946 [Sinanodonta woodiana]|uniref:Uncharacterized protein n=1 Tax=Sinanodonta woodiana TaxID=1069815 RepID=A0ABD3VAS1_SINWO
MVYHPTLKTTIYDEARLSIVRRCTYYKIIFNTNSERCTNSERKGCLGVEVKVQVLSMADRPNINIPNKSDQLLKKGPRKACLLDCTWSHSSCSCRKGRQPEIHKSSSLPVITIDHVMTEDRKRGSGSTVQLCCSKNSSHIVKKGSKESLSERNYLRVEECVLMRGGVTNRPSLAKSERYCMVNKTSPETRRYSMPDIHIKCDGVDNIDKDGSLNGRDMSPFYCLWNRPKSLRLLGRGALDIPKALKRQGEYRYCGCLTREADQHVERDSNSRKTNVQSYQKHENSSRLSYYL